MVVDAATVARVTSGSSATAIAAGSKPSGLPGYAERGAKGARRRSSAHSEAYPRSSAPTAMATTWSGSAKCPIWAMASPISMALTSRPDADQLGVVVVCVDGVGRRLRVARRSWRRAGWRRGRLAPAAGPSGPSGARAGRPSPPGTDRPAAAPCGRRPRRSGWSRAISSTVATNRAGSVIATHGLTIWAKNVKLSLHIS